MGEIQNSIIQLGHTIQGIDDDDVARRQVRQRTDLRNAGDQMMISAQESKTRLENLGTEVREEHLQAERDFLQAERVEVFKRATNQPSDQMHMDAVEDRLDKIVQVGDLELQSVATQATLRREDASLVGSTQKAVSVLVNNPGALTSVLANIEGKIKDAKSPIIQDDGSPLQVFDDARLETIKGAAYHQAYHTSFFQLVTPTGDPGKDLASLQKARSLFESEKENIQQRLGVESVAQIERLIGRAEGEWVTAASAISSKAQAEWQSRGVHISQDGLTAWEGFLSDPANKAFLENASNDFLNTGYKEARNVNRARESRARAVANNTSYLPTEEATRIHNRDWANNKDAMFAGKTANYMGQGFSQQQSQVHAYADMLDEAINQPFGFIPKGQIEFFVETMLIDPDTYLSEVSEHNMLLFDKIETLRMNSPTTKVDPKTETALAMFRTGATPAQISEQIFAEAKADPAKVEFNLDKATDRMFLQEQSNNLSKAVSEAGPHSWWGWNFGGTGTKSALGRYDFWFIDHVGVPAETNGQMHREIQTTAERLIRTGLTAEAAFAQARSETLSGNTGWAMVVDGPQPYYIKDSPLTRFNMGENAMNGVIMDHLIRAKVWDVDMAGGVIPFATPLDQDGSGPVDAARIEKYMSNFTVRPHPDGEGLYSVYYSQLAPNKSGELVYKLDVNGDPNPSDPMIIDFSPYFGAKNFPQARDMAPHEEWTGREYRVFGVKGVSSLRNWWDARTESIGKIPAELREDFGVQDLNTRRLSTMKDGALNKTLSENKGFGALPEPQLSHKNFLRNYKISSDLSKMETGHRYDFEIMNVPNQKAFYILPTWNPFHERRMTNKEVWEYNDEYIGRNAVTPFTSRADAEAFLEENPIEKL